MTLGLKMNCVIDGRDCAKSDAEDLISAGVGSIQGKIPKIISGE